MEDLEVEIEVVDSAEGVAGTEEDSVDGVDSATEEDEVASEEIVEDGVVLVGIAEAVSVVEVGLGVETEVGLAVEIEAVSEGVEVASVVVTVAEVDSVGAGDHRRLRKEEVVDSIVLPLHKIRKLLSTKFRLCYV